MNYLNYKNLKEMEEKKKLKNGPWRHWFTKRLK